MKSWSIGEVARLLGVKPHVLRYWEGELPLLSPPKGLSGRREYSGAEIRLLLRFRHLLYDKKFTVEGAKRRIWEELGANDPDIAARFAEVRTDLIDVLMTVRRGRGIDVPLEGEVMEETESKAALGARDSERLFAYWDSRPEQMKARLREDCAALDAPLLEELRTVLSEADGKVGQAEEKASVEPALYVPLARSKNDRGAREDGEARIRAGKTAFLTVAGGQGSRLGFEGPKGMFSVTPIRGLTLFALFAEKLLAARRWYGAAIPWLIMTGPQNHDATREYFASQRWFGLGHETVHLFTQASIPSLSPDGGLLLAPDGGLFRNPNGHGGVIEALRRSELLPALKEKGVEHLFYFQVDNPLVRVPDPLFLGFHCREHSLISSKVIEKSHPEEKLGVIVTAAGVPRIIEYSDLDAKLMNARDVDGRLLFAQGSPAIHLLDVDFLMDARLKLPWHIARKSVKALNPTATGTEIVDRDAVKMEMFIFDAIPLADRSLFFETERAEEFAPLKNREGLDSIETCRRGQIERAARWLERCGVDVPRGPDGRPLSAIEISPLFALDPDVLAARRGIVKDRIDEDTLLA
jgi:UDP-N-acetylglucosamine/UDP-N-acetylgalactosamine diphosphorylase